jgi:hypothetical protein
MQPIAMTDRTPSSAAKSVAELTQPEIFSLFSNHDPDLVWNKAEAIARRMHPDFDASAAHAAFLDVMRLFSGEIPGYSALKTPYHDRSHTLDVFMCAIRLAHGLHLAGAALTGTEITQVMLAAMMHDIGYVQRYEEDTGTGAQFTREHVRRGIAFMHGYVTGRGLPPDWGPAIDLMMQGTDHMKSFNTIEFTSPRTRMLAQVVATADLVGQMADRTYLEKLLFLYLEFKEANLGNYQSMHDMLKKTMNFYDVTRHIKLDDELEGMYRNLTHHFSDTMGSAVNYYVESMEKNIGYLSQAAQLDEAGCIAMLKRGGIAKRAVAAAGPHG